MGDLTDFTGLGILNEVNNEESVSVSQVTSMKESGSNN
jgi:hypothetical protein